MLISSRRFRLQVGFTQDLECGDKTINFGIPPLIQMTLNHPKINNQGYSKLELTPVQFSSQMVTFKALSS